MINNAAATPLTLPPDALTPAQRAAISYIARYSGHTHGLYASQLRRWFGWCQTNQLDPLIGIQRAHIELYIRNLADAGLMASSINTSPSANPGLLDSETPHGDARIQGADQDRCRRSTDGYVSHVN